MATSKHRGSGGGSEDRGKMRVRFMDVEIEGSNETLLESIRQITSATSVRTVVRTLPAAGAKALPTEQPEGSPADEEQQDAEGEIAPDEATQPSSPPAPARKPRRPRSAPKAPALSTDLNMENEPTPLATFMGGTKLEKDSSDLDKVVAVASWMRDHRQRATFTAADFYTACVVMDWDPPTDPTSPMRHLKRDGELDSPEAGKFSINMKGDKRFRALRK